MAAGQVNFRSWLYRVLAWDGILPVGIALIPSGIRLLMPHNPKAIEVAAVALPLAAFMIRVYVGKRHIASNYCAPTVRAFQLVIFFLGILLLLMLDALVVLSHVLPGGLFARWTDFLAWGLLFSIYLLMMAIAMYPGRTPISATGWDQGWDEEE